MGNVVTVMKLISMVEFINKIGNSTLHESCEKDLAKIYNYCAFLKQPLQLGFFIPCDKDGNILENQSCNKSCSPSDFSENGKCGNNGCYNLSKKYEQAKERVIFNDCKLLDDRDDCYIVSGNSYLFKVYKNSEKIEDLIPYNLTITENAIKKYKL